MGLGDTIKGLIGGADNAIDSEVNRVLERYKSDTPEQFGTRLRSISNRAVSALRAAVAEQVAVELVESRKADLIGLEARINRELADRSL